MTPREREIVGRLARRFPDRAVTADIREMTRAKGPVEALHIAWSTDITVDLERTIIAWPPESPQRIVEAVEAKLEMLGLTPSVPEAPVEVEPTRSRALLALRTPLLKLTSFLPMR